MFLTMESPTIRVVGGRGDEERTAAAHRGKAADGQRPDHVLGSPGEESKKTSVALRQRHQSREEDYLLVWGSGDLQSVLAQPPSGSYAEMRRLMPGKTAADVAPRRSRELLAEHHLLPVDRKPCSESNP
ncbi:hypothetical protein ABVT39_004994 [Epinephelus coioides]